jgi:hypothetical protein
MTKNRRIARMLIVSMMLGPATGGSVLGSAFVRVTR